VVKLLRHDIGRLPVVDRDDPRRVVGYFGRSSVLTSLIREMESEGMREPGLLVAFRRTKRMRKRHRLNSLIKAEADSARQKQMAE
jgi:hypothetical protein